MGYRGPFIVDMPDKPLADVTLQQKDMVLALEVALAGTSPTPVFVFDEVDAGIGGRAAVEVGRRLARLAASAQVIVVTHLPQVAAFADRVVTCQGDACTFGVAHTYAPPVSDFIVIAWAPSCFFCAGQTLAQRPQPLQ